MKKINHKSINLGLRILTILAFISIFVPFNIVAAQGYYNGSGGSAGYGVGGDSGNGGNSGNTTIQDIPYQAPIYTAPVTTTPIVYSNGTNPNPVTPTTVVVHKKKSTPAATVATTPTTTNPNSADGLAANAVYGSNSFLPSGLIQWILFAIFVLLIVILSRIVFGAKKKYQESPLKQE